MRRRLTRPLLLDAFVDATHGGFVRVRPTGTELVHSDDDRSDTHRLVIVRPNGTLWIIDSVGLRTARTGAPLSSDQLDAVASALDNAGADVDDSESSALVAAIAGTARA